MKKTTISGQDFETAFILFLRDCIKVKGMKGHENWLIEQFYQTCGFYARPEKITVQYSEVEEFKELLMQAKELGIHKFNGATEAEQAYMEFVSMDKKGRKELVENLFFLVEKQKNLNSVRTTKPRNKVKITERVVKPNLN